MLEYLEPFKWVQTNDEYWIELFMLEYLEPFKWVQTND